MTTVTIAEACENLPDLLRRAAAGEQIVITEEGKWLASLAAPPAPPTPEEEAARRRAAVEAFQKWTEDMRQWCAEDGVPFLPDATRVGPHPESPAAENEAPLIARREQIIREWLGLRSDAPVPKPEAMSHDEYMTRYRKAG